MRFLLGIVVFVVLFSAAPFAADGTEPLEKPWAKADGDFGTLLILTDKPDQLSADWEKPTDGVRIHETQTATRGGTIATVVVFTGCAPDADGNCQATVQYTVYGPDGKPYGEPIEAELWVDKPPPAKGHIQLAVGGMFIGIEPQDPLGVYRVKAKVVDKVAKKTLVLEREFQAVETPSL